jgi:hypothetical protein
MDGCAARTQGALVAALRARPRTRHRAVQCVLAAKASILNSPPSIAPLMHRSSLLPALGHYRNQGLFFSQPPNRVKQTGDFARR